MKCCRQVIIRTGEEFAVIGYDVEGNIISHEPMASIESATCYAVANITMTGRVTFQACAAEKLSEFVSGAVEDSNSDDLPTSPGAWNATLTSVWDDGVSLTTKCVFDRVNKVVLRSEEVELAGVDCLTDQYVTYDDEEFKVMPE